METTYQSGVKFAARPSVAMQASLNQWIGCQRVIYNAKTAEDRYFATFRRKSLSLAGERSPLDQQYSQFKSDLTPWLSTVPSQVLRNGAVRWMTAKQRQLKGLAGAPARKRASGRQSVLLTSELFHFEPKDVANPDAGFKLLLGTQKFPMGELPFIAHRPYQIPNQIVISRQAGKWFVSFTYVVQLEKQAAPLRSKDELAYELNLLDDEALAIRTNGYDRGVTVPLADAYGVFHFPDSLVEARIARKDLHRKRYQRRLARQVKGSANHKKTKAKIAKVSDYRARCTNDWAHKLSYKLVNVPAESDSPFLHVFEALQIRNMVRRPKAKQIDGKWVRNGAAAKSGLNSAILTSGWGRLSQFTQYKAARRNQLVLFVPPHHSSQECSNCGHTHPDNRPTQARFVCQRCAHVENADANAAKVIKKRGIAALRTAIANKASLTKTVKKVRIRKNEETLNNSLGAGCPSMSVERHDKTGTGLACISLAATKQKTSAREGASPVL